MLFTDADSTVKLSQACCPSLEKYKDHIETMENQAELCQTQQLPISSHSNKGGLNTFVPVFQSAAPPSLGTVSSHSPWPAAFPSPRTAARISA